MYENVPYELRALPQWVVVGAHKIPVDPHTGDAANVTNPRTWSTFEHACRASNGAGVGFVFTAADPYTFIDLDDPYNPEKAWSQEQREKYAQLNGSIYQAFATYAEVSRSGKGVHLICRGRVPSGARRDTVEVYSDGRYAIFTGHVLKPVPITEQQPLLDRLFLEMHPRLEVDLVQEEGLFSDAQICDMAMGAVNGDKYNALCSGQWRDMGYPSQSEADFALLSMLCFYSRDNEQVRRLFRMTSLGKRAKATRNDKYLNAALRKIRAGEPAPVDLSALVVNTPPQAADPMPGLVEPGPSLPPPAVADVGGAALPMPQASSEALRPPPGLVGQLAAYMYSAAVMPMREAAVAGALGLVAGMAGRAYNVCGTGLNQYIILLAPTGSGKDGAASGIDALLKAVRQTVPSVTLFKGPGIFSSGQALIKTLQKKICFVSVLGEFGLTLQQISSPRASSAEVMLRRVLLDLYTKSGAGRVLDDMVYSDSDKNTQLLVSPAVTLLGESVPSRFYENLDVGNVEEGLVPRFLILESNDETVDRNKAAGFPPDGALVKAVAELATVCLTMANNNATQAVTVAPEAEPLLEAFERHCNTQRREATRGADKEMWSRAYLKALKVAGVVAVGCNIHNPVVTHDVAAWALALVWRTTEQVVQHFDSGEVGQGEIQHESEVRKAILRYMAMRRAQRLNAKCPMDCIEHTNVVPFAYMRDQLRRRASFREHKMGVVRAVDIALKDALDAGILRQVPASQAVSLGIMSKCYVLGPNWQ